MKSIKKFFSLSVFLFIVFSLLCLGYSKKERVIVTTVAPKVVNKSFTENSMLVILKATKNSLNIVKNNTKAVFNHSNGSLILTKSDINLLAKLVYAESRGEPYKGKVGVASVVLNRVVSGKFPKTIKGVIFQKNAFSPVNGNDIHATPTKECYKAVYDAINGQDPTGSALYFYNPEYSTCSWMNSVKKYDKKKIGNHVFFRTHR